MHEVIWSRELDDAVVRAVQDLGRNSPESQHAYKQVPNSHVPHMSQEVIRASARSANGREGLAAFAEKRRPTWRTPDS